MNFYAPVGSKNATHPTGLGNLLVQASSSGEIKTLDDIRSVVRNSTDMEHLEPQKTDWSEARQRFAELT